MDIRTILLRDIERYCRRTKTAESSFGEASVKDGHLVRRLRAGRDIRVSKVEKIRVFMRANPDGLPAVSS